MTPDMAALAEACERAAATHDGISEIMAGRQPEALYHKHGDADVLRNFAREIREGRVILSQPPDDTEGGALQRPGDIR